MGYVKLIAYGDTVEIFRYERPAPISSGRRCIKSRPVVSDLSIDGKVVTPEAKPSVIRRKANIRRAVLAFRRLVGANLSRTPNPVFATFTYKENMGDLRRGRADFRAFARRAQRQFGELRFIYVVEFQQRGAIHFHALLWGLPVGAVGTERDTRMVAALWGFGFVDLTATDGSQKLASYMAKYMKKAFSDPRLSRSRAYSMSKGLLRPLIERDALLAPYFLGVSAPDLSTAEVLTTSEYDTQWLGRCNYQRFKVIV